MRVIDLIQTRQEVYSIPEETTVHEAARYLRDHKVRSVGVLNAGGRLSGVISQSDISDKVAAENKCPAWMRVSEVMTRDLLVAEESGRFRGMISVADLLQIIASDHKSRADMFEAFAFPQR